MKKWLELFKTDYFRNTGGKTYKWFKRFGMSYQCKLLYRLRKVQYKPSIINRWLFIKIQSKHGNEMDRHAKYGMGLYLGHNGPRYVNPDAIIGDNCNLNQNVTIGQENRGLRKGAPTIGNRVWIGANSVVVGKIVIGDNVLIAPGSFVNFDVPSNSLVIGNPGKIISNETATEDYINNIVSKL